MVDTANWKVPPQSTYSAIQRAGTLGLGVRVTIFDWRRHDDDLFAGGGMAEKVTDGWLSLCGFQMLQLLDV